MNIKELEKNIKEFEKNGKIEKSILKEKLIQYFDIDEDGEVSLLEVEYKLTKLISIFRNLWGF